jgi:glycosyltransferase involved in cell wall biosynthesis
MVSNEIEIKNNMKSIAILLTWSYNKDSRAQRIAKTLSKYYIIDIYTINNKINDGEIIDNNISIINLPYQESRNILDRFYLPFYSKTICLSNYMKKVNIKYDIIYCHDLPSLIVGAKLKDVNKGKLVYDIHDLFIETINQGFSSLGNSLKSKLKTFFLINLFKFFIYRNEKKYIKKSDLTYSVNESISDYITKLYDVNCFTIQNYPELKPNLFDKKLRKHFNLPDQRKVVLYHGNIGDGRHLENIVKSAYYFSDEISLVIIGNGYLLNNLKKISNPSNTYFLDYVPYNDLFNFISDVDLGLVLLEHINYSKKHASANKFFECMACGIPVIASKSPELVRIFNKIDVGFLIEEINPKNIALKINEVIFNSEVLRNKGNKGRKLYETELNWSCEEEKLISLFKNL